MASELPFKLNNKDIFRDHSLVNGEWVEAQSKERFDVVDPGTGKTWATAPDNGPEDVDKTVQAAQAAFESYRKV
ncbi:hypothetical protein KCU89_g15609, partial [Aureobasidium melanogenum]